MLASLAVFDSAAAELRRQADEIGGKLNMTSQAPANTTIAAPVETTERIGLLDVLRGIALLGMFLVHFVDFSDTSKTGFEHGLARANSWFFENRFSTMFAILFGVGFAV